MKTGVTALNKIRPIEIEKKNKYKIEYIVIIDMAIIIRLFVH